MQEAKQVSLHLLEEGERLPLFIPSTAPGAAACVV